MRLRSPPFRHAAKSSRLHGEAVVIPPSDDYYVRLKQQLEPTLTGLSDAFSAKWCSGRAHQFGSFER